MLTQDALARRPAPRYGKTPSVFSCSVLRSHGVDLHDTEGVVYSHLIKSGLDELGRIRIDSVNRGVATNNDDWVIKINGCRTLDRIGIGPITHLVEGRSEHFRGRVLIYKYRLSVLREGLIGLGLIKEGGSVLKSQGLKELSGLTNIWL